MALVGISNYGSSSSSDSETEEDDLDAKDIQNHSGEQKLKLPPPDLDCKAGNSTPGSESIFHNPYRTEKELNINTLSRHVLPSEVEEKQKEKETYKNEVKICRKFAAKGHCRFGEKCKFSHAIPDTRELKINRNKSARRINHVVERNNKYKTSKQTLIGDLDGIFEEEDEAERNEQKRKKRPGLPDHIIPSKKAVDMYDRLSKKLP